MAVNKPDLFEVDDGVAIDDGSNPSDTYIGRDAVTEHMVFQDKNTGPHTLTDLLGGGGGDVNVDGGAAASVYLVTQNIDGMGA